MIGVPRSLVSVALSVLLAMPIVLCITGASSAEMTPTGPTTRETLAYLMAHSVEGFESFVPPAEATYTDVPVDSCRYAEIEYVGSVGLLEGNLDGMFDPDRLVNRASMAYYTTKVGGWDCSSPPVEPTFADVDSSYSAYEDVECLISHGIAAGAPDGLFHPTDLVDLYDAAEWLAVATGSDVDPGDIPACLGEEDLELWEFTGLTAPSGVSVDPVDGSCWIADAGSGEVLHLAENGMQLTRITGLICPAVVSVNHANGSCWIGDYGEFDMDSGEYVGSAVLHLSAGGEVVAREAGGLWPGALSANSADDSCWVADINWGTPIGEPSSDDVVRLASNGAELLRTGPFDDVRSVSANPGDGSCWVAVYGHRPSQSPIQEGSALVHLDENGNILWRSEAVYRPTDVSVNTSDGSCWVANWGAGQVVHVRVDGTELWRGQTGDSTYPQVVAANSADGSCWVSQDTPSDGDYDEILHLAEDGTELWRGLGFRRASIDVNPRDGSCWVSDSGNGRIVHIVAKGYQSPAFADVPSYSWARSEIEACWAAEIVGGYGDGTYRPDVPVDRGQMAAYIARALAGGDGNVPEGPGTASFVDVPNTGYGDAGTDPHWAYRYVEYAVDSNVVQGYAYDDPENPGETIYRYEPTWTVTRDQMAVYVARAMVAPTGEAALADYVPAEPRNFPDVPNTGYGDDGTDPFWAYTHIEYCVEHGVVSGYDDGYYRPEWVVTRDQMAVYVARAFGLGG